MDKAKVQDFTSLINHLPRKTLSFSVVKSPLNYISLSLFWPLEAWVPLVEAMYRHIDEKPTLAWEPQFFSWSGA
jgi:hypothetical protein